MRQNTLSSHLIWEQATQWLSRTLAVVLLMILPGIAGGWLDQQLSTTFLMPLGFALGVAGGIGILLILARLFSPPARGNPLNGDDSGDGTSESDEPPPSPPPRPRLH